MDASTRVLLVDAFNLIRRIYEARTDGEAHIQDVIEASVKSLDRALRRHRPTHACIVFDSHDTTWRHLLYTEYKAHRKPTPQVLLDSLPEFREGFMKEGVKSLKLASYEADDQVATLAHGVGSNGGEAIILSTDKMFLQLLSSGVRVFNHFEDRELTADYVRERFGVEIAQLTDYWAMAGDTSNNIKGVPRIGARTAATLLAEYGTLEDILSSEDDNSSANRVRAQGDQAQLCKQLVTLKTDVELGINLKSLRL